MKTLFQKKEDVKTLWYLIDAENLVLGRLASYIAYILMGKQNPFFSQHVFSRNYIIVTNVSKIILTGAKKSNKIYCHHTGHPGGLREKNYSTAFKKDFTFPLKIAVFGMLPKNRLRKKYLGHLKIFFDENHSYEAIKEQIKVIDTNNMKKKYNNILI